MLTILLGKTCSGKTIIREKLVERGKKPIVTYTTRPIRDGEIDGVDYNFIDNADFTAKVMDGFFAEWKYYETVAGTWFYGSARKDYENADNSVIILTPAGYADFLKLCPDVEHKAIYIYANNKTIKDRLQLRGDSKDEAGRRIQADNLDFKNLENHVDKIFYNNFDQDLEELVDNIIKYIQ